MARQKNSPEVFCRGRVEDSGLSSLTMTSLFFYCCGGCRGGMRCWADELALWNEGLGIHDVGGINEAGRMVSVVSRPARLDQSY